jgi:hypothetical protein
VRVIRVDASTATILLTEAPAPMVRDRQTGEIAKWSTLEVLRGLTYESQSCCAWKIRFSA